MRHVILDPPDPKPPKPPKPPKRIDDSHPAANLDVLVNACILDALRDQLADLHDRIRVEALAHHAIARCGCVPARLYRVICDFAAAARCGPMRNWIAAGAPPEYGFMKDPAPPRPEEAKS